MRGSTKNLIKWIIYIAGLLILFVVQTTPGLFVIKGAKPVLIVPFAIAISMFERQAPAAVVGGIAGAFWDVSTSKLFGFCVTIIMISCVLCSLLTTHLLKRNMMNYILICFCTMTIFGGFDFLFNYVIWGYNGCGWIFINQILPMIAYTTLVCPLIFIMVKGINRKYIALEDE